jgi:bifunctional DNA-binding transcriptional regulator/antitoxin component of YhaV-PrlF toxin-antitoxin module
MIKSRISVEAQTVLPLAVRQHLGVGPGDVVYEIDRPGEVTLRPARSEPKDDAFILFDEWSSAADGDAYAAYPWPRANDGARLSALVHGHGSLPLRPA